MQDPQCQIPTAFLFILVWNRRNKRKKKRKSHSPSAEKKTKKKLQARTSTSHHSTSTSQVKTRKGQTILLLKFCWHFWNTFPFRYKLGHFWRHHQKFSLFWWRKTVRSYLGHNNWYSHLVWCSCNTTVQTASKEWVVATELPPPCRHPTPCTGDNRSAHTYAWLRQLCRQNSEHSHFIRERQ